MNRNVGFIGKLKNLGTDWSASLATFLADRTGKSRLKQLKSEESSWSSQGQVTRTARGVLAQGKAPVMEVFFNKEQNYSVSGYLERASHCYGEFYLCLDDAAEYHRQADKVNAAIMSVTEEEAFTLALEAARAAYAAKPDSTVAELSDSVLAALCTHWFSLPNGINVVKGGIRFDTFAPARCPGDYSFPSGYIFKPDPNIILRYLGPGLSSVLKDAVVAYIANLREANELPDGILSRAVFEAFPDGEDDLIARTIIGLMMGMLPTVAGNLQNVTGYWQDDGGKRFAELKTAYAQQTAADPYTHAKDVLRQQLIHAMQRDPVPDTVWRTAVKEHSLGSAQPVNVHPGDKVYVSIIGAAHEDYAAGVTDDTPIFGGHRKQTPHPQHACPGYSIAMGVLLGAVTAMVER